MIGKLFIWVKYKNSFIVLNELDLHYYNVYYVEEQKFSTVRKSALKKWISQKRVTY